MNSKKFEVGEKVVLKFKFGKARRGEVRKITPTGRYVVVVTENGIEDIYNFTKEGWACGNFWIDRPYLEKYTEEDKQDERKAKMISEFRSMSWYKLPYDKIEKVHDILFGKDEVAQ